jgi:tRNA threonylcarbamoyladenosine biosynthesis protein TsaB
MSALSFEKFIAKDFVDVAYFEPYYLKDFMMTTK